MGFLSSILLNPKKSTIIKQHPTVKSLFILLIVHRHQYTNILPKRNFFLSIFVTKEEQKYSSSLNFSNSSTCQGHVRASPTHTPNPATKNCLSKNLRIFQQPHISMPSPSNYFSQCVYSWHLLEWNENFSVLLPAKQGWMLEMRKWFLRGKKGLFIFQITNIFYVFLCVEKRKFLWLLRDYRSDDDCDGYLDAGVR